MKLKTLIRTNYQYFLLPLTFLAVWLASIINYLYCGMFLKAIKITLITFSVLLIFDTVIPIYLQELLDWKFINTEVFFCTYTYLISIPTGWYIIKDQKKNNLL